MEPKSITFLGSHKVTHLIIEGLLENHIDPHSILIFDPDPQHSERLHQRWGVNTTSDPHQAIAHAETLVCYLKLSNLKELLLACRDQLRQQKPLLILPLAGVQTQDLESLLGFQLPIVRATLNTAALLGCGATGLYANTQASEPQRNLAESIFRTVGITAWVLHEQDMDTVNALSGAGPAYFLLIMEALQASAQKLGLSRDSARILSLQTALGAARMALESQLELAELRQQITSPGSTTETAVDQLEAHGIREILHEVLESAIQKARELRKQAPFKGP